MVRTSRHAVRRPARADRAGLAHSPSHLAAGAVRDTGPATPADLPISVLELLRREGRRVPHAEAQRPLQPRPHHLPPDAESWGDGIIARRAGMAAGALVATASVLGAAVLTDITGGTPPALGSPGSAPDRPGLDGGFGASPLFRTRDALGAGPGEVSSDVSLTSFAATADELPLIVGSGLTPAGPDGAVPGTTGAPGAGSGGGGHVPGGAVPGGGAGGGHPQPGGGHSQPGGGNGPAGGTGGGNGPVTEVVDTVTGPVDGVAGTVGHVLPEPVGGVVDGLTHAVETGAATVGHVVDGALGPVAAPVAAATGPVTDVVDGVTRPVQTVVDEVAEPVRTVTAPVTAQITEPITAAAGEVPAPVTHAVEQTAGPVLDRREDGPAAAVSDVAREVTDLTHIGTRDSATGSSSGEGSGSRGRDGSGGDAHDSDSGGSHPHGHGSGDDSRSSDSGDRGGDSGGDSGGSSIGRIAAGALG